MSRPISSLALLSCLLVPAAVMAHPGGEVHSFVAGAAHPLSGLDHLLAMLAVGLLAGGASGAPVNFATNTLTIVTPPGR